MKVGDTVTWAQPQGEDEASERYTLIEHNGDRGFMRFICDLAIPPVQLVRIADIVVAEDAATVAEPR